MPESHAEGCAGTDRKTDRQTERKRIRRRETRTLVRTKRTARSRKSSRHVGQRLKGREGGGTKTVRFEEVVCPPVDRGETGTQVPVVRDDAAGNLPVQGGREIGKQIGKTNQKKKGAATSRCENLGEHPVDQRDRQEHPATDRSMNSFVLFGCRM